MGFAAGPARLNPQNLGGLNAANDRRSFGIGPNSEVGSAYRGGGDEDALSHFMGQSDIGGPNEPFGTAVGHLPSSKPPTTSGKR